MNKELSVDLLLYAAILAALSFAAHRFSPHYVTSIIPVGIGGAVLSAILGALGLLGRPVRRGAIVVMTALSLALLAQAAVVWTAIYKSDAGVKPASHIPTMLWLFSVGLVVNLIRNRGDTLFNPNQAGLPSSPRKERR